MISGISWQNYPPEKLLVDRFHITTGFHPGQRDIIEMLVDRKRVLADLTYRMGQIPVLSNGEPLLLRAYYSIFSAQSFDA